MICLNSEELRPVSVFTRSDIYDSNVFSRCPWQFISTPPHRGTDTVRTFDFSQYFPRTFDILEIPIIIATKNVFSFPIIFI